ncbi:L-aspartate oxidase [Salinibacterium sp. ZJ454]|uniref:L-aspartate oxidase n=1 Tax=Salinibacterium sp. ZJ454 TaxID=2708339 RepID=UPI001423BBBA|nr:L-aspartate oxidase [Salinibacterium sp. ZJ454]
MSAVVIVGTGIAGLICALRAAERHDVTLVTKAGVTDSATRYAQGGIAAAMFPDDSVASHVADTVRAAAGVGSRRAAEILCNEGPQRILDLIRLGVPFDRVGGQEGVGGAGGVGREQSVAGDLARGREAAHSVARVLHAGGDATGRAIETALVAAVRAAGITVLEQTMLTDLALTDGKVGGIHTLNATGRRSMLRADAVILATGGAGQLYRHTTNPAVSCGDGLAAAIRAGAAVRDLEFYQFHPTSLAVPGNPLVSEAVRGEGAVLLDDRGRRFMPAEHPDAELAPRDVVARAIAEQMQRQDGAPVLLDATALGRGYLSERFPEITRICRANGLDWAADPVPVTPAAHYWMGGIRTDHFGRTSIPGLFAVGEVACSGVHGANRLASNSLLEALVFAWRSVAMIGEPWPSAAADRPERAAALPSPAVARSGRRPAPVLPSSASAGDPFVRVDLQRLMWDEAGLYRTESGLRTAADRLAGWRASTHTIADREDGNLLTVATALVSAALARRESRGAHFRSDYPAASSLAGSLDELTHPAA